MLKLEWDGKSERITLGKRVWESYTPYPTGLGWALDVIHTNGIKIKGSSSLDDRTVELQVGWDVDEDTVVKTKPYRLSRKEFNKAIGDKLGASYATLFKHFMALQFKVFIGDDKEIVSKISPWNHKKGWDMPSTKKVQASRELLRQVHKDGLDNLLPLVAQWKKSPQDLKKHFQTVGQSQKWKTLSKNSLAKNMLLLRGGNMGFVEGMDDVAADTPSTVLKTMGTSLEQNFSNYLANNFKGKWTDRNLLWREYRLYGDTKRMAEANDEPFSPTWTARRMHEEHDRLAKLENKRQFSPEPIKALKDVPVKELHHKGYVARLLPSAQDIGEEGVEMGHCVAMYANEVKKGRYLVYSVTKDGKRSSTIGIDSYSPNIIVSRSIDDPRGLGGYRVQQHYGKFNAHIEDVDEKEIGDMIVAQLNEEVTV